MISELEIKKIGNRMINACKRLHMKGILSGVGGNISIRTSDPNIIICSPSGIPLMDMFIGDLCVIDIGNIKNEGNYKIIKEKCKPTTEFLLHCGVYKERQEVKAIIHSHPPITTAFSCTNKDINYKITEDQRWYIGDIESIPFVLGSTKSLAKNALSKLKKNYVLILKNHGIVVLGDSLAEAVNITELVEDLSKIYYYSSIISNGNVAELPKKYWENTDIKTRKDLIYHDEIFD